MNLLIASHDLYPDPGSGGTGRYVFETARELARRGHAVSVITRRRGDVPDRESVDGVEVYRYDVTIAGRSALDIVPALPDAFETVAEYAADLHPDLVSFQGPVTSLFVHHATDRTLPRSCTFHSPWPAEYLLRTRETAIHPWRRYLNASLRARLEGYLLSNADEVVTLSSFMRDRLREQYAPDAGTAVVPGGVDTGRFSPDAGQFDPIDPESTSFLTVRRLSPRMGHRLLLEAFATVSAHRPDARLYIAGDGPLRERLEEYAATLGIDHRSTFLGYVEDEDLPAAYASADLFVLPTTQLEGFGLATLEALAAGTPVVGTPVGGTVELLHEVESQSAIPESLLLPTASREALTARMLAWADLPATVRAEAGAACRQYVRRHFTWTATVDDLERRYRALLGRCAWARP